MNNVLKLISDKIASLKAENENLGNRLVTQESMALEESNQNAASINDDLIQLEAHLRNAREGWKINILLNYLICFFYETFYNSLSAK